MRGTPLILVLVAATAADAQQQGSIQVSTDTQILQGDRQRRGSERSFEPDFGAVWTEPGRRFGQFQVELRASRRGEEIHLGRTWLAVRDAKIRGLTWTFEGGDLYTRPELADARFTNLSPAAITFTGGAATARSPKTNLQLIAGRSTAWRNIFGTDPDALGQTLGLARATYEIVPRLQVTGRASRVRTADLKEFTRTIDASDQAGGGFRLTVTPSLYLVGDGSYVRYRATGATTSVNDYSYLGGAHMLLGHGWVQVNASRFSPGDMPVLNATLHDREGVFSAGEYDFFNRVRLFGGWERIDTNIQPSGTALLRPVSNATRSFAGVRLRVAGRTSLSIRREEGDRVSRPVFSLDPLTPIGSVSDTGALSAELQTSLGRLTAFGRFTRRENVDSTFTSSTFTQDDGAAQFFLNLSRGTQLFGVATLTKNQAQDGAESTFLQVSAGGQQQIFKRGLWLRVEGTGSRNEDVTTGLMTPRNALSVGLNGQVATNTTLGLNVYVDRAPVGFPGDPQAWLARTTVRIVHTIPTGSIRVASSAPGSPRAERGTGTISGSVFADWNANGQPDAGEEVLAGIPIALGTISHLTTGRDGQFSFLNVPSGAQSVRLDLNALPVDYDAPAATDVSFEISRGETRRVAFGLLPLGGIRGRVHEDVNKNGVLDPGEPALDGAVLVLDGGQRSEAVRKGQFRFDAVRAGDHRLELLKESLPEGAAVVGAAERPAPITRDAPQIEVSYLVTIEKRPEVRRVFPSRGGGGGAAPSASRTPAAPAGRGGASPSAATRARTRGPATAPARTVRAPGAFTVQIAALTIEASARQLVADLKRLGFDAYVVEPGAAGGDGLYRVRVGTFQSRAAAQRTVSRLEDHLGLKLWVTRK